MLVQPIIVVIKRLRNHVKLVHIGIALPEITINIDIVNGNKELIYFCNVFIKIIKNNNLYSILYEIIN
tara:strand:- start:492 stop:695 length:204 start_codon:yes stop_codon:yes gene_type:complete